MAQEISDPITTLYIFKRRDQPVAIAIGDYPPDPGPLRYDSLLRIPIMANGDQPSWRAFEHRPGESIGRAMARGHVETAIPAPVDEEVTTNAPAEPQPYFTVLGTSSDGRLFVRDRRTRQILHLAPEEVARV